MTSPTARNRHSSLAVRLLLSLAQPVCAAAAIPGQWGTSDTTRPAAIVWPADWPGEHNLRAQWFKILADAPQGWVYENHAKGEPPGNTYFLWRGDRPLPEGTKLLLEGDFPHCRFFEIQVGAPWDDRLPSFGDGTGIPEIALLDEDIEPDPGHTNPFRPGADRRAASRHFHVTLELRDGNPVALNPRAGVPPYRAPGNLRIGGTRHGPQGEFGPFIWIRLYLPDGYAPFGGVEPPVLRIQYPGREPELAPPCRRIGLNNRAFLPPYALADNPASADGTSAKEREATAQLAGLARAALDAGGPAGSARAVPRLLLNPDGGWWLAKAFTTARYVAALKYLAGGKIAEVRTAVPAYLVHTFGMGPDQPPPGNDEHSSDHCNFNSYLLGAAALPPGQCLVIRGTMPRTPRTLDGRAVMEPSDQLRYWNLTLQGGKPTKRTPVVSLVDEEVVLDAARRYTIVISTPQDRPANATAENGITWRPWPLGDTLAVNLRLMSTTPDPWEHAPQRIGWTEGDLCSPTYDRDAVRKRLAEFYPDGRYLTTAAVEALGRAGTPPFAASYPTPEGAYGRRAAEPRPLAAQPPPPTAAPVSAPDSGVQLDSGPITGESRDGIRAFKGIPYAAPPVGALRWQPPQPPAPWTAPRACVAFGAACPQEGKDLFGPVGATDEDCLYVNVWTPAAAPATKLPVMVWIHGGGFFVGTGGKPCYDGAELARRGQVVVVTLNYRLGPFGFLAHPALTAESPHHASGNYGLLDQIAALHWVQRNIAAFGGDPGNVTIFGQSAGGVSVCALMASPLAVGLFHRAIVHSGSAPLHPRELAAQEAQGTDFARRVGAADLAALRALPASTLLAAWEKGGGRVGEGTQAHLCVDGYALPEAPGSIFAAGRQQRVPLLAGTTKDEDPLFRQALLAVARTAATVQPQTFVYEFRRTPDYAARARLGCFHGVELPYLFRFFPAQLHFTAEDARLSDVMIAHWTAFARSGDPNPPGMPATWSSFSTGEKNVFPLDVTP